MTERVWHKGPPPHIGWWNASMSKSPYVWRFWDGTGWRQSNCDPGGFVDGACVERMLHDIEWCDHWPENARVPRVDPAVPANRGIVESINMTTRFEADGEWWARKAWYMYHGRQMLADAAAAGSTRTVREMKERMKPGITSDVPARMSSNGQAYLEAHEKLHKSLIPERRELSAAPTRELVRELFRRLG